MLFLHLSFKYLLNSLFFEQLFSFVHAEDMITGKIIILGILIVMFFDNKDKKNSE